MCSDERIGMHFAGANIHVNPPPITAVPDVVPPEPASGMGGRRWLICGLLFFAATVNYMDRQVIALLKPTLQIQFGWTEVGYSNIVTAFQFAYGAGLLFIGKLIDRLGTRKGFSLAVFVWSAAAMAHAAAGSVFQFAVARFSLGIGEAGSFPASVKAVAEWFPKRERALTTGLFNSGSNIGALVTPLVVPWITRRFGWRMAFIATGALGFLWIVCWLSLYHRPEDDTKVSAAELAHIQSDPPDQKMATDKTVPWKTLLTLRQAWAIAIGKFFTDPIWWVYLFWMPDFLSRNLGLSLSGMALPLFVIYSGACVGSIGGGWLSGSLLKRGWTLNASRKSALLLCALAVTPIMISARTTNAWLAVCLIAIAAGAHQGWSANIYTLASDMFPRSAVASVVGFATMVGAFSGMFVAKAVGYILQRTGSYVPVFLMAGLAYLVAFGFVQVLAPRLEPAEV
ncbi:MAG TPA: MFS transporter [Candidatus Sulfotelmatobacter sp.]|nr:MFS transporter [Candidatus Sulfotelmatobacter sp.]